MKPAAMEPDDASPGIEASSSTPCDFGFAFDNSNFSDRLLRIEIVGDGGAFDRSNSIADWASERKGRRDKDDFNEANAVDTEACLEEQIVRCNQPVDDVLNGANDDGEPVAVVKNEPSGDEALNRNDSNMSMGSSTIVRVKTLHISSPIMAAKSPFFYKLFSNGMRESEQRHVTLRINAYEEAALMELLNFMYSNSLSSTTVPALLEVLMEADKFEVASCMKYCSRLLRNLPMTQEYALLYLYLPSSVSVAEAVLPLAEAAKQFLATRYRDITKYHEGVMELPLLGIKAVLSSDDLQVASEDVVYDFTVKWARTNYPNLEERREILGTHLIHCIHFPFMSFRKLRKVLMCNDFVQDIASKVVLEALFFKAESPHRQRTLAAQQSMTTTRRFIERAYKCRPVKVVKFDAPHQQCIVYLDIKREECANLFPSGCIFSQGFHLGGQELFLSTHCNMDQQNSFHCFGLFLGMQEKVSVNLAIDYEFAARTKPSDEYTRKYKGNYTFTVGNAVGFRNVFGIPWSSFMADNSPFFINGILHLRADITIKHSPFHI